MSPIAAAAMRRPAFLAINASFVVAAIVLGAFATWPIYQSPSFVILVVASSVIGAAIAFVGWWQHWSWFTITLVTIGTYLVLGVPLAVPASLVSLSSLPAGWLQFLSSTVFGWKQLVTVTIPVGSYQGLLVPALLLFFTITVTALSLMWRTKKLYVLAVPLLLLLPLFGLVFGSSAESARVSVLWSSISPREFAIGLCSIVVSLAFLIWRARHSRATALRAGGAAVVRQSSATVAGTFRRVALAGIMLFIAVLIAGTIVPQLDSNDRQVLRTAIDPEITVSEYISPLSQYRSSFTGEEYERDLFTVSGDNLSGERLRLAVLSYYDGEVYSVVDPVAGENSRETAFARVPSQLDPAMTGSSISLDIAVEGYSGVWLPTAGALESVRFLGDTASSLTDGFFYNHVTRAGVDLALLSAGDQYSLTAVIPNEVLILEDIERASSDFAVVDDDLMPANLKSWVRLQSVGSDVAGLQTLVDRLRARGYLSHSLLEPTDATDSAWIADLGNYAFEPSLAGHSIDRIDALFGALIAKQNDTSSDDDADLVAAVGDDEQFAVATALMAQYLGFPARIVLGFDLEGSDDPTITSCDDGTCRGKNLMAWVEVASEQGEWARIDVTPQHEIAVSPLNSQQRDPENLTEVVPDTATEEQPPEANPTGGDQSAQDSDDEQTDLSWLASILQIVGGSLLILLVLFAPLLLIIFAKFRRRRSRHSAPDAESRIVGGWDEYVDAALDVGKPLPTSETRTEIARLYGTPRGVILATMADRAVFHAEQPDAAASTEFWRIVESERRNLGRRLTKWQRFRSAISIRSFTQHVRNSPVQRKR